MTKVLNWHNITRLIVPFKQYIFKHIPSLLCLSTKYSTTVFTRYTSSRSTLHQLFISSAVFAERASSLMSPFVAKDAGVSTLKSLL